MLKVREARGRWPVCTALAALLAALALCPAAAMPEKKKPASPPPFPEAKPAVTIDVGPLGFRPPGAFYLTYRLSSAAIGFFDDDHLLFTFHMGGLLKRSPDDPRGDDDQEIRAVVLDLGTGKVTQQAKWRLHDRSQYLWPYKDGKFLVRVRDSLFMTDQGLQLEPYMTFDRGIRAMQVSPDHRLLVVETNDPAKLSDQSPDQKFLGGPPVKVRIYALGEKRLIAESSAKVPTLLPLVGDGLLDLLEGRAQKSWVMRDVPFEGEPRTVAEVKSSCQPSARPLSATVVLTVGCYGEGADDRQVIAVSTKGDGELWRDRWQNKFVWGWFDSAANGSRFIYESIQVNRSISTFDSLYPEDIQAQMVGVYDTETGKLVLVRDASPVLTAGQNAALSPDGKRFAILRNGAIEVYDLPPVSKPEPKKAPEMVAKKPGT
ncbi:MAG TPA: hypothetical protein VHE33_13310 [Acidobacteriaceae bacterium]|nr:hypothetical protein [Acidobacteriaceae bacterium]